MDDQMNNNGPVQYQPTQQIDNDKDGYAVAILVLGILSICFTCWCIGAVLGIIALVLYAKNKEQISSEKQGMVTAGFVTSIVGTVLSGFAVVYWSIIMIAAFIK